MKRSLRKRTHTGPLTPIVLFLSGDGALVDQVAAMISAPWVLAHHAAIGSDAAIWEWAGVAIVVLDDDLVAESERGWLLTQVRKHYSEALLLYLAGTHSALVEKRARTNGALYYAAKPVGTDRLGQVIRSFMDVHERKARSWSRAGLSHPPDVSCH